MPRWVLIGGAGLTGLQITKQLISMKVPKPNIIIADLKNTFKNINLKVTMAECDIAKNIIPKFLKDDIIIHLAARQYHTKIPKRNANYKHKVLSLKKGNMIIFDSGLWHKGGESTNKSRWTIFNYYGPWWMKPYYSFDQMLGKNKLKNLNTDLKKMLHYYSKPPKNSRIRANTLTSPVEKKY